MAETKWDELQTDCLVNIFAKLKTDEIVESVQFVCKSWYQASLDPKCWQTLTFVRLYSRDFVEFVVRRSQHCATAVTFGHHVTDQISLISQNCPRLKFLYLPSYAAQSNVGLISDVIHNWKDLEHIGLSKCDDFGDILKSISRNCKNFTGLMLHHMFEMGDEEAALIVKFLPKLKVLSMPYGRISRSSLVMILECCKELESVNVSRCNGFDEMDDEIVKLAANIKTFNSSGSCVSMLYDLDYCFILLGLKI